jgi:hypothetical protein
LQLALSPICGGKSEDAKGRPFEAQDELKPEKKIFLLGEVFRGSKGAAPPDYKSGAATEEKSLRFKRRT